MKTEQETLDVLVFVEKDGADRFKIRSEQLEQIGEKLRGFSIFNSIILPAFVAVLTVLLTGLFQYISWHNQISLQNATDIANRAKKVSDEVTTAVGQRSYATFVFIKPLKDMVEARLNLIRPAETTGGPARSAAIDDDLEKHKKELARSRFVSYYEQLKNWNEKVDQLITDVDYALDMLIFSQAFDKPTISHESIGHFHGLMQKIECESLDKDFERINQDQEYKLDETNKLDRNRLKHRLVWINYCFININKKIDNAKSIITEIDADNVLNANFENYNIYKKLNIIKDSANELQCHALYRVDYYDSLKERSIVSPYWIWKWLTDRKWLTDNVRGEAQSHFVKAAERCSMKNSTRSRLSKRSRPT